MLTFEQMKELLELVARHRLSGLEVERSGFRFKVDGLPPQAPAAAAGATVPGHPLPQSLVGAASSLGAGLGGGLAGGMAGLGVAAAPGAEAVLAPSLGSASPPLPGAGLPVHAGELGGAGAAQPVPGAATAGSGSAAGATAAAAGPPPSQHTITSPIVGTFYRAPSPEASPFTEIGARVRKGQVVCIIEAMKLMNEIESDVDGTVTEIYPQNAQPVEFGEPLFGIRPA